jgi:hypothetical protein
VLFQVVLHLLVGVVDVLDFVFGDVLALLLKNESLLERFELSF